MKATTFAEWLEQARERRGLSQNQLAIAAGLDPSTINKMEAGLIDLPRKASLRKLAPVLEVTEAAIFEAAGLMAADPDIERIREPEDEPSEEARYRLMAAYDKLPFKLQYALSLQAEETANAIYEQRSDIVGKNAEKLKGKPAPEEE